MVQKDEKKSRFLLNMAFYAVILALVFLFFRYLLRLMMPFFLALAFASLSRPLSRFLSSRVRWKKNEKGERVALPRRFHLNPSLAGILSVLLLFALLIIRGFWIALHARDRFSMLLATGLTTLLAIQVVLNVAVVTNLLPSTGISLPFFSSGGTALIMQLAECGIVLNISRSISQSPK